jgi:hypothetical protein
VEKINAHEDLKKLRVTEPCITMVDGKDRRIITYPCRNSTLLNFVCCLRKCFLFVDADRGAMSGADSTLWALIWMAADVELNEISEEKWTAKGDVEALVKSFSTLAPEWQKLLS